MFILWFNLLKRRSYLNEIRFVRWCSIIWRSTWLRLQYFVILIRLTVMIKSTRWIDKIYKNDMTMWYFKQTQNEYIFDRWLWLKSSDDKTCIHALLELIAFAIKNVTKCWLFKLLNNHHYHEEFQSSCKNDDENKAFKTI